MATLVVRRYGRLWLTVNKRDSRRLKKRSSICKHSKGRTTNDSEENPVPLCDGLCPCHGASPPPGGVGDGGVGVLPEQRHGAPAAAGAGGRAAEAEPPGGQPHGRRRHRQQRAGHRGRRAGPAGDETLHASTARTYTYMHTYMHTYIHTYIHTYTDTYIHRQTTLAG